MQAVANLELLPGTLVLCASPCLWYGLTELLAKLPADCFVLALEKDENLHEFAKGELKKIRTANTDAMHADATTDATNTDATTDATNTDATTHASPFPVALLEPDELLDIVEIISSGKTKHGASLPPLYRFRRAIILEMSGGTAFFADLYKKIAFATENAIATFWKNRVTLTRLGRLFSRNVFHNLARLPHSTPLASLLKKIDRPIVVFGAGESAGKTIASVPREDWQDYFVLAVDAVLPVLKASGIEPDGIVAVESQLAIEKAYIGCTNAASTANNRQTATPNKKKTIMFADICSRAQVTAHVGAPDDGAVSYFASDFADTHFLKDLQTKGLLPPQVPALGSVGLTAVYLALQLRATTDIPVYVTGLDFSFSLGATHTRGAPAHTARLCMTNRLRPLANYDAAFRPGATCVQGKNGTVYTDQALSGYAQQFAGVFAGTKNLFDIGESGLDLGIARVDFANAIAGADTCSRARADAMQAAKDSAPMGTDRLLSQKVTAFFAEERKALFRLKNLLVNGDAARSKTMSVQEEITAILARREYLYLHFPDGYECRASDISFLKRVRSEIDFFLKDMRD